MHVDTPRQHGPGAAPCTYVCCRTLWQFLQCDIIVTKAHISQEEGKAKKHAVCSRRPHTFSSIKAKASVYDCMHAPFFCEQWKILRKGNRNSFLAFYVCVGFSSQLSHTPIFTFNLPPKKVVADHHKYTTSFLRA